MICADEDSYDQVGYWQEGHDRDDLWDYVQALLAMPSFLKRVDRDLAFSLGGFSITEYERDKQGHPSVIRSEWENTYMPEQHDR